MGRVIVAAAVITAGKIPNPHLDPEIRINTEARATGTIVLIGRAIDKETDMTIIDMKADMRIDMKIVTKANTIANTTNMIINTSEEEGITTTEIKETIEEEVVEGEEIIKDEKDPKKTHILKKEGRFKN